MPAFNVDKDILSILVSNKKLTQELANSISTESITTGESVENLLIKYRLVTETDIAKARATSLNIPFISLTGRAISPNVISYIPEPVSRKYTLVPFQFIEETNELYVAMLDPLDFQIIDFLEKKSGKKIVPYLGLENEIKQTIELLYQQNLGADVTAALKETTENQVKTYEAGHLGEVIREAPIAQIVSAILEQSIKIRASDIHIEPQSGDTRVRFRVDGILQEQLSLPRGLHEAVVSRIKILSDMKIDEKRIPQDGRFNFKMGNSEVDLRVSTLPTVHGEKIVMRILKKSGGIPSLNELGLRGSALKHLEEHILKPHGTILVTGPTGSGKTTTLYSILSKINNTKVNILTLEDPVEYEINGINQVQINPSAGLTFATGLRSFLRQDPNIILVGEIRDKETTELVIQASLTGHLVFSTLHTNSAAGAIPRLIDLGAEPFLVSSALNLVVAQRITRKLCNDCKELYTPNEDIVEEIKKVLGQYIPSNKKISLWKPTGEMNGNQCKTCGGSGYFGRIGIFEVFPMTDAVIHLTLSRASANEIEAVIMKQGMITMKQDGFLKALEGITTIEEVLRVAED
ncbi:MAG: GspE/PulE family protein [Patescibacteria group bacterium]|nr:GspE/PulE family protein [Patescibacteria group bacterium]